jgi:hypothetical protein
VSQNSLYQDAVNDSSWTSWPRPERVYQVAGTGFATDTAIAYFPGRRSLERLRKVTGAGDGTVEQRSASASPVHTYYFDLYGYNKNEEANVQHGSLMAAAPVWSLFMGLLNGDSTAPAYMQSIPSPGVQLRHIKVTSVADVHVYDAYGRHMGVTSRGRLEANIPNGRVRLYGDRTHVSVDAEGRYRLSAVGRGFGLLTLRSEETLDDEAVVSEVLTDIPVSSRTRAEVSLEPGAPLTVNLDVDGDGSRDFAISAESTTSVGSLLPVLAAVLRTAMLPGRLPRRFAAPAEAANASWRQGRVDAVRHWLSVLLVDLRAERGRGLDPALADQLSAMVTGILDRATPDMGASSDPEPRLP